MKELISKRIQHYRNVMRYLYALPILTQEIQEEIGRTLAKMQELDTLYWIVEEKEKNFLN